MKRVIFNSTTVMQDGTVMIQLRKQFSDDGITWENLDYHRITVAPAGDLDSVIPANNAALKSMGFKDGLDPADIARCKAHIALAVSTEIPLSDSAAVARVETESQRQAEIEACRKAVDDANALVAEKELLLQAEIAAHADTKATYLESES
jgi:hypothetical protein